MDAAIGIVGKDFVMVMADMTVARSILSFKHDDDKIKQISPTKVLATTGDYSSRTGFAEYIEKNVNLLRLKTNEDLELSVDSCAHFIRRQIAKSLRSRAPVQCNSLFAGVDKLDGPALYYFDYIGSMQKVQYSAHGYCSNFTLSILDKQFRTDLTQDEARAILLQCISQLKQRFLVHMPRFIIKTVTVEGTQELVIDEDDDKNNA